jgi:hypothetical protein
MSLPPEMQRADRITRLVGAGVATVGFGIAIVWAVAVVSLITTGEAFGVEATGWIGGRYTPWILLLIGPFFAFFVARFGIRAARR